MNLAKTSALNGSAVLVRIGTMLLLNKVLAVQVGPSGYAVIGQFQNLVAVTTTLAGGAVNTGVTKYTAEYQKSERTYRIWSSAATLSGLATSLAVLLLVVFRTPLATWTLADPRFGSILLWFAGGLGFAVANAFLLAILNGRKAIKPLVVANILGSLVTAAIATILVLSSGLYGALVALATGQAAAFVCTAFIFLRVHGDEWRHVFIGPDRRSIRAVAGFALMSLTSALAAPLSQLVVRDGLIQMRGLNTAGLWQALWRISDTHLMLLTSTLTVYFLPRFSELVDPVALKAEVMRCYRFVLPLSLASALLIFVSKTYLVKALLSPQFAPVSDALGYQLVGDILKINSWVVGFTLISHARKRAFIATEIVFSVVFCLFSLAGAALDSLRGVAIGYAATYALYGGTVYWLFHRYVQAHLKRHADTAH